MSEFTGCNKRKWIDEAGDGEHCKYCAHNVFGYQDNFQPMTNADRIRNMSDEELAVYTCEIQQIAIDRNKADRVEDALKWLQAEVKEGNSNENT